MRGKCAGVFACVSVCVYVCLSKCSHGTANNYLNIKQVLLVSIVSLRHCERCTHTSSAIDFSTEKETKRKRRPTIFNLSFYLSPFTLLECRPTKLRFSESIASSALKIQTATLRSLTQSLLRTLSHIHLSARSHTHTHTHNPHWHASLHTQSNTARPKR